MPPASLRYQRGEVTCKTRSRPTALLDKEMSDVKTKSDMAHWRKLVAGEPVTQTGDEGALARTQQAANTTGKALPPGARSRISARSTRSIPIQQSEPFPAQSTNNPVLGASDAELDRAVLMGEPEVTAKGGQMSQISVPKEPKSGNLYVGKYTRTRTRQLVGWPTGRSATDPEDSRQFGPSGRYGRRTEFARWQVG